VGRCGLKLLIVDDQKVIRRSIHLFLKDYNIEVVGEAADGEEAVQLFKKTRPDVVTVDITMPKMDGLACIDELKKVDPNVRIMVITALADRATGLIALTKGARSYINKPINPEKLIKAFDKLLKREKDVNANSHT